MRIEKLKREQSHNEEKILKFHKKTSGDIQPLLETSFLFWYYRFNEQAHRTD